MRSLKSELAKLSPPLAFQVRETHAPSSHSGCYFTALEAMHESGTTPLSAASRLGHLAVVEALVQAGAEIVTGNTSCGVAPRAQPP